MQMIQGKQKMPLLAMVHGEHGTGKTQLAETFPDPFFIVSEENCDIESKRYPRITSWPDFLKALNFLKKETFQTLVIDTIDGFQDLLHAHILDKEKEGMTINKAMGGYGAAASYAQNQMLAIRDTLIAPFWKQGKHILILCHTQRETIDNPLLEESYTKFTTRLHANSKGVGVSNVWCDWVDNILFMSEDNFTNKKDGKAYVSSNRDGRLLYAQPLGGFQAKSRLEFPPCINIPFKQGWNLLEPHYNAFYKSDDPELKVLKKEIHELLQKITDEDLKKKTLDKLKAIGDNKQRLGEAKEFIKGALK